MATVTVAVIKGVTQEKEFTREERMREFHPHDAGVDRFPLHCARCH
jgi:hypothetical protein